MKIVLATGIYPPEIGGPASFTRTAARWLAAKGHEVFVVCYGDERTAVGDGWPVRIVSRSGGAIVRYARYAHAVWQVARTADVVFLQGPVSEGAPGTAGAWMAGKPTVMKIVGDYAWEYAQQAHATQEMLDEFVTRRHGGTIGIIERLERWSAARAARIVTPSAYLRTIVQAWGIPPRRIDVVYNSIAPFHASATREVFRAAQGVEGKRVVFTASRAVPWKHVDFLINIITTIPDAVLVYAGDGPELARWRAVADEKNVANRVRFLGRIDHDHIGDWYAAADVFALASSYEGLPHVALEALSVGTPCVVSNMGGNPELLSLAPSMVRVVPFLDARAWTEALGGFLPERVSGWSWTEADMMRKYESLLRDAAVGA